MPDTAYTIQANISEFEWHVIQHLRRLAEHGFGQIHVIYAKNVATRCEITLADDPAVLRTMQDVQAER